MPRYSYDARVDARIETAWKVLAEMAENPAEYQPGVVESRIVQHYDDGYLRELRTQETAATERIFLDERHGEVRYQLLEHPFLTGQMTVRVAPTSVQNPMSPVIITMTIDWTPKAESGKIGVDRNFPDLLRRDVATLKRKAEELEQKM